MYPRILQRRAFVILGSVFSIVSATVPGLAQQQTQSKAARTKVERSEQLPIHVYAVTTTAAALLEDDKQFAALARALERDLRADLATYDIQDMATLKSYYGTLSNLALLRSDYSTAVAYQDSIRAIEPKPVSRLMTGIEVRAIAAAARGAANGVDTARFRDAFRSQIAALPYVEVHEALTQLKASRALIAGKAASATVPAAIEATARSGSLPRNLAQQLVAWRVRNDRVSPIAAIVVDEVERAMAAHSAAKPDIWAARDVSFDGRSGLTPVIIGIWDSGTDVSVYPQQLFTNTREVPDNGKDDDGNGYVDDVHGIAHDDDGQRVVGLLRPISLTPAEMTQCREFVTVLQDLQSGVRSPETEALVGKLAALPPAERTSFREKCGEYAIPYSHGTHVAGVAVRGNPAARILVARFGSHVGNRMFQVPPRAPTLEHAQANAREMRETIAYFRDHGVRVVNMSWHFAPVTFESLLAAANSGGTPEERRRLARQIYDIGATALREAMAGAPEILFVAAAGNDDADNRFDDFVPATFDLPNLITVGAVDAAGDPAGFTSYGKTDVYANGVRVLSKFPGGAEVPQGGTSNAAPQVVNLAAKLLAVKPDLTVAELRRVIVESADEKTIGEGKRIKLLNPKAALGRTVK
jgi:hypothetical protein